MIGRIFARPVVSLMALLMLCLAFVAGCDKGNNNSSQTNSNSNSSAPPANPNAVEVLLLYGSEKQSWIDDVTPTFNASNAKLANGKVIHVSTTPMGSGESKDALLSGHTQATLWSPASGVFVQLGNAQSQIKGQPLIGPTKELVLSPVVIAMWKPMAQALGWPGKAIGWADVIALAKNPDGWAAYGHKEFGRLKFGHTHPEFSNSGLISILAEAYAGAGKVRGLTTDDLAKPEVGQYMADVEQSIVHYGSSTGFFGKRLIQDGPQYLSAAVLYENMVIESYSQQTSVPLVAIYPKEGTIWSDHPIGIVQRPWVSDEQKEAGQIFIDYLRAPAQQQKALQYGFRPAEGSLGAPLDAAHGVDPAQPQTVLELPSAAVIDATIQLWKKNKKHSDIALIFDKSGSMNDDNKIGSAKKGAIALVNMLAPEDSVTFIPFSTEVTVMDPVVLGTGKEELINHINMMVADGNTHLFQAIKLAKDKLMARRDPKRIQAIVVLTDGEDNGNDVSLSQLLDQLQVIEEDDASIRVFTIGYGNSAKLDDLKRISKATQAQEYQGNPDNILSVFRDIATFF